MQVSIITSLFNRLDLTRAYLASLERTLQGWDYEVILVDDASTDGTRDFLATLPAPRYRVIRNDTPRSFAANNNAAARLARAPLLGLLNNDLFLLPGWLEPMARLAATLPDVGCVGNVQREPVSGLIDHCGFFFDADGHAIHAGKNEPAPPPEDYLCWPAATAACWVIRRDVFLGLGGFDEAYRNGFEDVDFCLRASAAGYRHFVANRSVIYHHISASPGRSHHEDANLQLFRQRWQRVITETGRGRRTAADLRADGGRYLRKHAAQPWRYNVWRFFGALEKWFLPRPADRGIEWLPRAVFAWQDHFRRRPALAAPTGERTGGTTVYLVVSDTVGNADRSGIPTLVRNLAAAFGRAGAAVRPVLWNAASQSLCLLPPEFSMGLDAEALRGPEPAGEDGGRSAPSLYDPRAAAPHDPAAGGPSLHEIPGMVAATPESWVLMPEVLYGREAAAHLANYVHRCGWRLAMIFHDAIPVKHPEYGAPGQEVEHVAYMHFSSAADLILPVSERAARDWEAFVEARGLRPPPVKVCTPGADTCVRVRGLPRAASDGPVRVLCVSAVADRKNHRNLLAAFDLATAARPDLALELRLVGAARPSADDLPGAIHEAMARHPGKIHWYERADYSALRNFYETCDFTVYPSEMEGFGLPIIESLWFGRPCVCANFGAMAETAAGGGCLTTDVRDPQALADALVALAGSAELRGRLAATAAARPIKTWDAYAAELLASLSAREKAGAVVAASNGIRERKTVERAATPAT